MEYDFYYNQEIEQFKFLMIPKLFFEEDPFINLSAEAKILYALLFDRMKLSKHNKWFDEHGRVFIFFTLSDAEKRMNCCHDKVTKTYRELESVGLVYREPQGFGLPYKIYVKNFISQVLASAKKSQSSVQKNRTRYCDNIAPNNNDYSNTNNELIDWQSLQKVIKYNISYDDIMSEYGNNITIQSQINEIVRLIVDVIAGYRVVKIDSNIVPKAVARERYLLLRYEHIKYVIESIANLKAGVTRIDNYVCTALYNATLTCNIADMKGFTSKTGVPLV